jgi:hypothetical protein
MIKKKLKSSPIAVHKVRKNYLCICGKQSSDKRTFVINKTNVHAPIRLKAARQL